jgi:hypothetical protein
MTSASSHAMPQRLEAVYFGTPPGSVHGMLGQRGAN